jgi:hypothetical protein
MRRGAAAVVIAGLGVLGSVCGKSSTGPSGNCGGGPVFTVLPVPASAILAATPVGNMGPPVHTIPTDHAGFYLMGTNIPLSSPAPYRITSVRTTRYLASTFRAGQSDYSISGTLCSGYQLGLNHLQTVVAKIQSETGGGCTTYSTANETIEACTKDGASIDFSAGEQLGTVGGASAAAFDFGLYQTGHQNAFVNPSRYSSLTLSAVCPYDPFTASLRMQVNALMGQPGTPASGENPICGTMNVDRAGTIAGVWVLQSDPVNQTGDETNFVALAPNPLAPESAQTFSVGPASLASAAGNGFSRFPIAASGRVNRRFGDVTADNLIYCYNEDATFSTTSYFVRLSGAVLTLEKVPHAVGGTACASDPASWVFDATALSFIR